ncbi:hypothetical protein GCM10011515_23360 [Tsuneonella deserti]|uniref:Uncharacterized protein n=1 Tax=Tsuneonella deserti TaxID=2035528 RepID=A0ABQ1S9L8_9SPHN|nr:hypothetical protein GCM10011515_23360 [Tsuneonella deserti]
MDAVTALKAQARPLLLSLQCERPELYRQVGEALAGHAGNLAAQDGRGKTTLPGTEEDTPAGTPAAQSAKGRSPVRQRRNVRPAIPPSGLASVSKPNGGAAHG